MALELLDARLELRLRRRNVRQLDDVRLALLGELAEFGEVVANLLLLGELCTDRQRVKHVCMCMCACACALG